MICLELDPSQLLNGGLFITGLQRQKIKMYSSDKSDKYGQNKNVKNINFFDNIPSNFHVLLNCLKLSLTKGLKQC